MKKLLTALLAVAFLSGIAIAAEAAKPPPTNSTTGSPSDQKLIEESHKAGPAKKAKKSAKKKAKAEMPNQPPAAK